MAEGFWGKLRNRFKQYGFTTLIKRILNRVASKFGFQREVYFYCGYDLRNPFKEKGLPEGYSSKILTLEDLEQHSDIPFSPQKMEVFRMRLNTPGYTGIGIFHNGRVVGFAWLSVSNIEMPFPQPANGPLQLAPDEGYLLDAFSHPDHRGQGFHPFYTWWRYDALKKAGKHFAVTIIDEDNRSARTAQAKSGFRILKKLVVVKSFGKTTCHSEPSTEQL